MATDYEEGHDDGIAEVLHDVDDFIHKLDPVVLAAFIGWLAGIFITDALFARYRRPRNGAPVTYSGQARNTWWLRGFFWYLALHMTRRWRWDPLVWVSNRLEKR